MSQSVTVRLEGIVVAVERVKDGLPAHPMPDRSRVHQGAISVKVRDQAGSTVEVHIG